MVGEIAAKFGAAMAGFWWSLDERERMILLAATLAGATLLLGALGDPSRLDRGRLAVEVADELERRGRR